MAWFLAAVSLLAVVLTGYDKWAAKHRTKSRIPERVLLTVAGLGGSVAMLLIMLLIRHKTRHAKFMVGLPLMILAQIALILVIFQVVF
jgi:uncharacterized membrane protein YsdA (DUF1294 family)